MSRSGQLEYPSFMIAGEELALYIIRSATEVNNSWAARSDVNLIDAQQKMAYYINKTVIKESRYRLAIG